MLISQRARVVSLVSGLTLGVVGLAGTAASLINDPDSKITICPATNSESNPYNKITVSRSAVADNGHRNHTGPVWYPGAKEAGVRWGDIIPPSEGVAAQNWPEGESIFNNGCETPGVRDDNDKPDRNKPEKP